MLIPRSASFRLAGVSGRFVWSVYPIPGSGDRGEFGVLRGRGSWLTHSRRTMPERRRLGLMLTGRVEHLGRTAGEDLGMPLEVRRLGWSVSLGWSRTRQTSRLYRPLTRLSEWSLVAWSKLLGWRSPKLRGSRTRSKLLGWWSPELWSSWSRVAHRRSRSHRWSRSHLWSRSHCLRWWPGWFLLFFLLSREP